MWVVMRNIFQVGFLVAAMAPGAALAGIWQDLQSTAARGLSDQAPYYRALSADEGLLRQQLANSPLEQTASQGAVLELPLPNGENQRFEVVQSPILSPALAARHPDIQTYSVTGLDDPSLSGRLDMSPSGFHAMLSTPSGMVFIDPDEAGQYRSFYKRDFSSAARDEAPDRACHTNEHSGSTVVAGFTPDLVQRTVTSNTRRNYRLALVTTGEYGSFFGSQSLAESAVITTINRVNQIYGRDLAVQLQLVEIIVYTDAGDDPFDNPSNLIEMLTINQELLDFAVGLDNYDIGHLFGISSGGVALLGSACTTERAQGYTGHLTPNIGDPFDVDFVAHEVGHQLNATHTFNGTTGSCGGLNRTASSAVEPGSGTTIMAYAGICGGENLQLNSDATFHSTSIGQITDFVFSGTGNSCGTAVSASNSLPSSISAGSDVTIPSQTPFMLTGSVSADPDGDSLSYQWDQINVGTQTNDTNIGSDLGDNPLFRSFVPKSTPTRYFPRLSSLIGGVSDIGETLPTTSRQLDFRMTVRDGRSGVGDDDVRVTVVAGSGPFQITGGVLNEAPDKLGGSTQILEWDVGGTGTSCPTLRASLLSISADGSTYCDADDDARLELATGVLNTGTASLTLPSALVERVRVMLSCENNVFFALSHNDFAVMSATAPVASNCKMTDGQPLEHGTVFVTHNTGNSRVTGGGGSGALYLLPLLLVVGGAIRLLARRRQTA